MTRARNIAVILLWLILAWRVTTLILDYDYDRWFLIRFALFAWLGGLVTNEVIRMIVGWFQDEWTYRKTKKSEDEYWRHSKHWGVDEEDESVK